MTDIPPVNPSGTTAETTESIIIESTNKKIGTSESIITNPSIAEEIQPSERDQQIINAFLNAPIEDAPTTTSTSSTAQTESEPSTVTGSPTTADSTTTTTEGTEEYSDIVNTLLACPYVQSSPTLTQEIENNPDQAEQGVETFVKQSERKKQDKEAAQENAASVQDAYAAPADGDDTQSSKYSGS